MFPVLGSLFRMITDPAAFWDWHAQFPFSVDMLGPKVIVHISDVGLSKKVFANVSPNAFKLVGHPQGEDFFGAHNVIYQFGDVHKELRREYLNFLAPQAVPLFASWQQEMIDKHLAKWPQNVPVNLRTLVRDMNLATSQRVFCGDLLTQVCDDVQRFNDDFLVFLDGFLSVPIKIPGLGLWNGLRALDRLVLILSRCAAKARLSAGRKSCILELWVTQTSLSDLELGHHVFDMLFAAQDASTSSIVWAMTVLHDQPDIRQQLAAEPSRIGNFVRELLRWRPPATLVPHIALHDFPLTDSFTIPKNAIVFPSILEASRRADTPSPASFVLDREPREYGESFLTFGHGPHGCPGKNYAMQHLSLFVRRVVETPQLQWRRLGSDNTLVFLPTIYPKDQEVLFE